jgi:zinc transporter ZupT
LPVRQALLLNFVAGFSVLAGGLLVFCANLSAKATGCLLAMSAGVYIYIAAAECCSRIQHYIHQQVRRRPCTLVFLTFFILGAVPIGMVLMNHHHCEAGHDDEALVTAENDHDHFI